MNRTEAFTAGFIGGLATGIVLYNHYTDRISVHLDDGRRSVPLMSGGETPDLTAELVKRWQEIYGDESQEERIGEAVKRGMESAIERDRADEDENDWITLQDLMEDVDVETQTFPHQQAGSGDHEPDSYGWNSGGDEPLLPDGEPIFPEDEEAYQDISLGRILEEKGPMTVDELTTEVSPDEHMEDVFRPMVEVILERMEELGSVTQRDDGKYVYNG